MADKQLGKEVDSDVQIATGMIMSMLMEPQALQGVQQAMSQSDPVLALSNILAILLEKVREQTQQLQLDDRIWSAEGGVIDQVVADASNVVASLGVEGADQSEFGQSVKEMLMQVLQSGGQGQPMPEDQMAAGPPQQSQGGLLAQQPMGGV